MDRAPAVAGSFYPGEPEQLARDVAALMGTSAGTSGAAGPEDRTGPASPALGLLAPHAGYVYSGAVAGATYARVEVPERAVVLCPNHTSFLDGFLIAYAVPKPLRNHLFSLGYSRYFDIPVVRNLSKLIRIIPVDSSRNVVAAMQVASYILRKGQVLCVFPEGARSPTGEVGQFKKGAAILAKELAVKLVPVYIHGSYEAWPTGVTLPRAHPIRVVFGRGHSWEELRERGHEIDPAAADYDAVTLGLREEVLRLKDELEIVVSGQ